MAGASTNKVIVVYDAPEGQITKVWRFNPTAVQGYKLEKVKADITEFFPCIKQRRVGISLSYQDSLAGTIVIESDADLQVRLTSLNSYINICIQPVC